MGRGSTLYLWWPQVKQARSPSVPTDIMRPVQRGQRAGFAFASLGGSIGGMSGSLVTSGPADGQTR